MSLYHIPQGEHAAKPKEMHLRWRPQRFFFDVTFNDGRYHLKEGNQTDTDQKDWNKLCGLSFNVFTNHQNSFMFGWRYNLDTQKVEVNRYQHLSGQTVYDKTPFASLHPIGGRITGTALLEYRQKRVRAKVNWYDPGKTKASGNTELVFDFHRMPTVTREINLWFGGNEPAPVDLFFLKETRY